MNLTQFEWIETDLKRAFYDLKKLSGIFVNFENVFWDDRKQFTFLKEENVLPQSRFRTAGLL